MTAGTKIKAGFGAGFAFFLLIIAAAVVRTFQFEDSARKVEQAHEVIERLQQILLDSEDAGDATLGFVLSSDQRDLARAAQDMAGVQAREREVEKMVSPDPDEQKNVIALRGLIGRKAEVLARAAQSGDREGVLAALAVLQRSGFDPDIRATTSSIAAAERSLIRGRIAKENWITGASRRLFGVAAFFSLGLIVVAGWRVSTDVGKRLAAEHELSIKEEQYRQVVETAGDIICRTDFEGRFTFCNKPALDLLHFGRDEVIGRSYLKLVRKDKRRHVERFYLRQFARKHRSSYYEFPIVDGYGAERWVGQNVQLLLDSGKIVGFQAIARDITDRRRTEFELQRSRKFIERIAAATPGILYVYDLVEQRSVFSNREAVTVLGFDPASGAKQVDYPGPALFHPDDQALVRAHHEALRHARDGEVRRVEYRARHAQGHWVWLSGRETPFERGPDGLVKQIVGISQDITERKAAQDKVAYRTNFDALTGLANRGHFRARLQAALRRASLDRSDTAVCLFDVDRFNEVNDRFGHAAGDEVLEAIGHIVQAELRASDLSGHLGDDEFCFVLSGADVKEAVRVAERIRERLSTLAFGMSGGSTFSVTATFGIVHVDPDTDMKHAMESVHRVLSRAKAGGRNRVVAD